VRGQQSKSTNYHWRRLRGRRRARNGLGPLSQEHCLLLKNESIRRSSKGFEAHFSNRIIRRDRHGKKIPTPNSMKSNSIETEEARKSPQISRTKEKGDWLKSLSVELQRDNPEGLKHRIGGRKLCGSDFLPKDGWGNKDAIIFHSNARRSETRKSWLGSNRLQLWTQSFNLKQPHVQQEAWECKAPSEEEWGSQNNEEEQEILRGKSDWRSGRNWRAFSPQEWLRKLTAPIEEASKCVR